MKVFFLIRALEAGGAERQLATLALGLKQRGHDVTIGLFYACGELLDDVVAGGVTVLDLGKTGRWDMAAFFYRTLMKIRQLAPDVVYSFLGESNIVNVVLSPFNGGAQVVLGCRSAFMDLTQYDWLARYARKAELWLMKWADCTIANSQAGKDILLAEGQRTADIAVVHNGFDTHLYAPDETARMAVRSEWGVRDDEIVLGMVGRLDPMKDHETFFQAAQVLANQGVALRVVCVGRDVGAHAEKIKKAAQALGVPVLWAGIRKDMLAVYNAMDVHCLSSKGEGFPNVVGESMACGVPNVVTDVGDCHEFACDGCCIVGVGDVHGMAAAIQRFAGLVSHTEEWAVVSGKARNHIVKNFDLDAMVDASEALLEGLQ